MKILIYGPGVLGSLLGARLIQAGEDVTLLARGQRLQDLRTAGITLECFYTGERLTLPANVIERLQPEDAYDLVLVVMGSHQVASTLPSLAANRCTPNILFIGNSLSGPTPLVDALGRERVLRGFYAAGGKLDGPVVYYADGTKSRKGRLTMGELDGAITPRLARIAALFEKAGVPVTLCLDIDAWLKTHAALIAPLGGAVYLAGGPQALSQNRAAVALAVMGFREALLTLRVLHISILPGGVRLYERIPEGLLVPLLQRLAGTQMMSYAFSHAEKARPEIRSMAGELLGMAQEARVPAPALEKLRDAI